MVREILWRLTGAAMVIASILFIPHCDGDGGWILLAIPLGLYAAFGPRKMYK